MRCVVLLAVVFLCLMAMAPCLASAGTSPSAPAVSAASVSQPEQLTPQEMDATTGEWVTIYTGNWFACQYQLFANAGRYNGMWIVRINFWTYELRGNPKWSL